MNITPSPRQPKYDLSVIVIFYNMRREAYRTLHSLTKKYQRNVQNLSYEIIAIDNGSSEPLDEVWVKSLGENFRYIYFDAANPSPCDALNHGVQIAYSNLINVCIDGARILSPGVLHLSMLASKIDKNPFIYTMGMHIGSKPQPYLVEENYSQNNEDDLINSVNWSEDGYELFEISSPALSSPDGFLSDVSESNSFTMLKSTYLKLGGYNPKFVSPGGGISNLDFFIRAIRSNDICPIMLLGEATFHQFHGGVATNVPTKDLPFKKMTEEYRQIYGEPFQHYFRPPIYFGEIHPKCNRFMQGINRDDTEAYEAMRKLAWIYRMENRNEESIQLYEKIRAVSPKEMGVLQALSELYAIVGNDEKAKRFFTLCKQLES